MLFISSFSFGLFLPDCCNFQHLRKLQIQRHPRPRNRACVWGVPILCYPYSHGFTHCLLVLRGHNRAPDQAAGLMQPTSMSCPHMQAAAELCTGCFLAKLPSVVDQSVLTVGAVSFGFHGLGNTEMSRGRELFHSNACKERDSFICSSVNIIARWLRQICRLMTQKQ